MKKEVQVVHFNDNGTLDSFKAGILLGIRGFKYNQSFTHHDVGETSICTKNSFKEEFGFEENDFDSPLSDFVLQDNVDTTFIEDYYDYEEAKLSDYLAYGIDHQVDLSFNDFSIDFNYFNG